MRFFCSWWFHEEPSIDTVSVMVVLKIVVSYYSHLPFLVYKANHTSWEEASMSYFPRNTVIIVHPLPSNQLVSQATLLAERRLWAHCCRRVQFLYSTITYSHPLNTWWHTCIFYTVHDNRCDLRWASVTVTFCHGNNSMVTVWPDLASYPGSW